MRYGEKKSQLISTIAIALVLFLGLNLSACEKEPGKGGLATIKGKVFVDDINAAGIIHDSGYGGDIQVDISYGNNTWVDASERTSASGEYAFLGLQKGNYNITVYSRCDTCLLNQRDIQQAVEISETRQVAVLPDFVVFR